MVLHSRRPPSLARVPVSPLPRGHEYYEGATTSRTRIPGRLLVSLPGSTLPSSSCLAVALPSGRRVRSSQDRCSAGVPAPAHSHMDVYGISQVPRRSIPCLCPAPGPPAEPTFPRHLAVPSVLPPHREQRRLQQESISRLTLGFSTRCLRFKGTVARPRQGSLPAGWPLPEGSRTPKIATKGFRSLHGLPPFQGLP